MLNIKSFVVNPFQENTYVIENNLNQCWIIDPGMYDQEEINTLITYIDNNKLQPQAIINTHTHLDHIFGAQALIDRYKIPFGIHEKDLPVLNNAAGSAIMFGLNPLTPPKPDFYIREGESFSIGKDELEVRFTPGHSPGSIVFYYAPGDWVIAGDVLFSGSIGRTDLPGGNFNTLLHSIKTQLFTLPPKTIVYPGHGPSTIIFHEQEYNPFLQ